MVLSVSMKAEYISKIKELEEFSKEAKGVFSIKELETLFNVKSKNTFFNIIKSLEELKIISNFKKGIYITEDFDPLTLSARIDPNSYISLGTVLSKNALIGTMPNKEVSAVRVGRNREYFSAGLKIKHYGINASLNFGFTVKNGIRIADNEKAFIDTLYYSMKGSKFVFNPTSDIDFKRLDSTKICKYLENYKNKRFVTYCKDVING